MKGSWIIQKSKQLRLSLSGHVRSLKPDRPSLLPFILTAQTLPEKPAMIFTSKPRSVCVCLQINRVITERLICDVWVFVCCLLSHSLNSGTPVWKLNKNRNNRVDNYPLTHCSNLKSLYSFLSFFPLPFAFVTFICPVHASPPSLPSLFFVRWFFLDSS